MQLLALQAFWTLCGQQTQDEPLEHEDPTQGEAWTKGNGWESELRPSARSGGLGQPWSLGPENSLGGDVTSIRSFTFGHCVSDTQLILC